MLLTEERKERGREAERGGRGGRRGGGRKQRKRGGGRKGRKKEKNGTITTWQILLNVSTALKTTNRMLATVCTVSSINTTETDSDKLSVDSQMLTANNILQRVY